MWGFEWQHNCSLKWYRSHQKEAFPQKEKTVCEIQIKSLHLSSHICNTQLRLQQTFAGVLQKKNSYQRCFQETHTNYISIKRLWNIGFEKNNVLFGYSFHKATEAGKHQNDWLTFRRIYRLWNAIVDKKHLCSVNQKASISQSVSELSCISIGYLLWNFQAPASNNSQNVMF